MREGVGAALPYTAMVSQTACLDLNPQTSPGSSFTYAPSSLSLHCPLLNSSQLFPGEPKPPPPPPPPLPAVPTHEYTFQVFTSDISGAGTDADVFVVLYGDGGAEGCAWEGAVNAQGDGARGYQWCRH